MSNLLTTHQVAETLGVTIRRVQALIKAKRLRAVPFGRVWMIRASDVEAVRSRRNGRPPIKDKSSRKR